MRKRPAQVALPPVRVCNRSERMLNAIVRVPGRSERMRKPFVRMLKSIELNAQTD